MTFEFLDTAFAFVTPNRLLIGLALAFLATLNVMTYVIYRGDKLRAMFNEPRVPERSLLALAFYGGSLGAKVAQLRFRHKTRKQPFKTYLNAIVLFHVGLILWGGTTVLGLLDRDDPTETLVLNPNSLPHVVADLTPSQRFGPDR